jgi:parallel beta-helix repeat protein
MIRVNVKIFGAKGDGITDDTVSIQNAINSVASNFILEFPNGTYVIDTLSLTGKSNFRIEMKGFAKPKGDIAKVIFNMENCSHFSITPMIIPPTDDWKSGRAIELNNCSYGIISNGKVSFTDSRATTSGDFIRIGSNVDHIDISNNTFKGTWGVLSEDKIGVHDINVMGNTFYGCKPYVSGDLVEFNQPTNSAHHIVISKNTFSGTKASVTGSICIGVANCEYVTISENTILDSGYDGIHVEDRSKHVRITDNVISNCNGFCISVCLGVEDSAIEGNRITQSVAGIGKVVIYCCGDATRKNQNIKISNNIIDGGSPTYTKFSLLMTYCKK